MKRSITIAIPVVALVAVAGLTYFGYTPIPALLGSIVPSSFAAGSGVLNVYITDAASASLKSLILNVTSLTLSYQGNVTTTAPRDQFVFQVPSSTGMNVDITKLQGSALLLGATNVPSGNVTRIMLNITGAKALFTDGTSAKLKVVANGELMIPFHFQVHSSGSVDLTIDILPNTIRVSKGVATVLKPVIHLTAVQKSNSATITTTA